MGRISTLFYLSMKNLFFLSILFLIVTSCANFEEPEFISTEGIKMGKIEARNISVTANIKVSNPNWFAIKIKPSDIDAYIENQYMGKIFLEKKVKMHPKSETVLSLPLRAELADGAMITALKYATKDKVALHVKGKIKAGVWFISKKFDIDETKTISGKNLVLGTQD
jgi:LEA14-like dessication related protein